MLDAFIRTCSLVKRGDSGLVCDDEGLALGLIVLAKAGFDRAGQRHSELRPTEDVAEALRLAHGPISDRAIERWSRSLAKVAELLTRGEHARARIYAVMLGFPEIAPDGMVKLARASALRKYNPDWEAESRVPSRSPGGGQWTSGDSGIEIAARGDLPCQGCPSGGSYGTTGMYTIEGKILCFDCAVKATGTEGRPGAEKIETLKPYLLPGK
jgi:hypothetical protein